MKIDQINLTVKGRLMCCPLYTQNTHKGNIEHAKEHNGTAYFVKKSHTIRMFSTKIDETLEIAVGYKERKRRKKPQAKSIVRSRRKTYYHPAFNLLVLA